LERDKLAMHSSIALRSSGVQVMEWELDSGAGENVVQWRLCGRSVRQNSPVKVQHAQKSMELTGGLWKMAVLEVDHSLFQRLGTRGGHLVTKEADLGCSEGAPRRVDDDPIPLKLVEESP
jgi:hypothetical protein